MYYAILRFPTWLWVLIIVIAVILLIGILAGIIVAIVNASGT